jgi:hypothetical protein
MCFSAAGADQAGGHVRLDDHDGGCDRARAAIRPVPVSVVVPLAF